MTCTFSMFANRRHVQKNHFSFYKELLKSAIYSFLLKPVRCWVDCTQVFNYLELANVPTSYTKTFEERYER